MSAQRRGSQVEGFVPDLSLNDTENDARVYARTKPGVSNLHSSVGGGQKGAGANPSGRERSIVRAPRTFRPRKSAVGMTRNTPCTINLAE